MRADQAVAARRKANGRALPPLAGPLRDVRSAPRVEHSARDRALPARQAGVKYFSRSSNAPRAPEPSEDPDKN